MLMACVAVASSAAHAGTIHVPHDYSTIQEAIDIATPGDVISVTPGVYRESLEIDGKDLTLRSSSSTGRVIVDGDNRFRCLECRNVTSAMTVSGLIFMDGQSPLLNNPSSLPARGDDALSMLLSLRGGGVLLQNADVQFENCVFEPSSAYEGGLLYSWLSKPSFEECLFTVNKSHGAPRVTINTIGRGTASFSQCQFGGTGVEIDVYPVELDRRRHDRRPRSASEESVAFTRSTFELRSGINSDNSNVVIDSCEFDGKSLGRFPLWFTAYSYMPWSFTRSWEVEFIRNYFPNSGQWKVDVLNTSISGYTNNYCSVLVDRRDATFENVSVNHCEGGIFAAGSNLSCESCDFHDLSGRALEASNTTGRGVASNVDLTRCHFSNILDSALFVVESEVAMTESLVENCNAVHGGFLKMYGGSFKGDSNEIRDCNGVNGAMVYASGARVESSNTSYSRSRTVSKSADMPSDSVDLQAIFHYFRCEMSSVNDTYFNLDAQATESHTEDHVVYHREGTAVYEGLVMSGCSADRGSILNIDDCDLNIEQSNLHHNIAGADGHILAIKDWSNSELHISNSEFANNLAKPNPANPGQNAVVHIPTWRVPKLTSIGNTTFCGNRITAIDIYLDGWTDNGGNLITRRCLGLGF